MQIATMAGVNRLIKNRWVRLEIENGVETFYKPWLDDDAWAALTPEKKAWFIIPSKDLSEDEQKELRDSLNITGREE